LRGCRVTIRECRVTLRDLSGTHPLVVQSPFAKHLRPFNDRRGRESKPDLSSGKGCVDTRAASNGIPAVHGCIRRESRGDLVRTREELAPFREKHMHRSSARHEKTVSDFLTSSEDGSIVEVSRVTRAHSVTRRMASAISRAASSPSTCSIAAWPFTDASAVP
ncbi:MAG: hypothetical protein QOE82_646, partial [Thermoanaerobaculia bacterium]|nr:hypothetical protein [Thermoanaerobaculia bacterium]